MVQLYRNEERVVSNRPCGRPVNDSQSSKEAERGNNVCHTFFCILSTFSSIPLSCLSIKEIARPNSYQSKKMKWKKD